MLWWRNSHWYSLNWSSKSLWYNKQPYNAFIKSERNSFLFKFAGFRSYLSSDQTHRVNIKNYFHTVFLKSLFLVHFFISYMLMMSKAVMPNLFSCVDYSILSHIDFLNFLQSVKNTLLCQLSTTWSYLLSFINLPSNF